MRDQMITVLLTVVGPLLLMNSINIAKAASAGARSLAAGALRRVTRTAVPQR